MKGNGMKTQIANVRTIANAQFFSVIDADTGGTVAWAKEVDNISASAESGFVVELLDGSVLGFFSETNNNGLDEIEYDGNIMAYLPFESLKDIADAVAEYLS